MQTPSQGDQIGRIFAFWAIVYSGQVFENNKSSQIFGPFLSTAVMHTFLQVMGWATFWVTFSHTQVTLIVKA
jgi:hypothetical protein